MMRALKCYLKSEFWQGNRTQESGSSLQKKKSWLGYALYGESLTRASKVSAVALKVTALEL
jgi:hypothetical protein